MTIEEEEALLDGSYCLGFFHNEDLRPEIRAQQDLAQRLQAESKASWPGYLVGHCFAVMEDDPGILKCEHCSCTISLFRTGHNKGAAKDYIKGPPVCGFPVMGTDPEMLDTALWLMVIEHLKHVEKNGEPKPGDRHWDFYRFTIALLMKDFK